MAHVEASVDIQARPEDVWTVLNDLHRIPEWLKVTEEILSVSEGPIGVGTVWRERTRYGPRKLVTQWRITSFEPPRRHVHEQEGEVMGMDSFVVSLVLDPVGDGTRLSQVIDYHMVRWLGPLGWLMDVLWIRRQAKTSIRISLANLKALIEANQS